MDDEFAVTDEGEDDHFEQLPTCRGPITSTFGGSASGSMSTTTRACSTA